jgi:hypothetical protein
MLLPRQAIACREKRGGHAAIRRRASGTCVPSRLVIQGPDASRERTPDRRWLRPRNLHGIFPRRSRTSNAAAQRRCVGKTEPFLSAARVLAQKGVSLCDDPWLCFPSACLLRPRSRGALHGLCHPARPDANLHAHSAYAPGLPNPHAAHAARWIVHALCSNQGVLHRRVRDSRMIRCGDARTSCYAGRPDPIRRGTTADPDR